MRKRARTLRVDATRAERIIWRVVRAHRLLGVHFRRQTPIGPYIVDFVSHRCKVIVELDGGQHFDDAYEARDARRDRYLRAKGFHALRFSNYDVMTNLEGVWDVIAAAVGKALPPPYPPPQAGEGLKALGKQARHSR